MSHDGKGTTGHGWRDHANCRRVENPADFSPVDSRGRMIPAQARLVADVYCGPCPVRDACRAAALDAHATGFGPQELVQGGLFFPAHGPRSKANLPAPIELLGPTVIDPALLPGADVESRAA